MTVKETGHYSISVYQQSKRKVKNPAYSYSSVRFVVMRDKKGEFSYITSINKNQSHAVSAEVMLENGTYYIAVKMDWETQTPRPIVLTSYGSEKVEFENLINFSPQKFKAEMIKSFSEKYRGKIKNIEY